MSSDKRRKYKGGRNEFKTKKYIQISYMVKEATKKILERCTEKVQAAKV